MTEVVLLGDRRFVTHRELDAVQARLSRAIEVRWVATDAPGALQHGLVVAARADDAGVEAVELQDHPFFIATLFQPQMGASSGQPIHPLIRAFIDVL